MQIKDCILLDPITCAETETLEAAAKKLKENKLRHLYVVAEDKTLLGVFAGTDIVCDVIAEGKDCKDLTVKDIMKKEITTFKREDPVIKAIGFMSRANIASCPITEEKKLFGILSFREAIQRVKR